MDTSFSDCEECRRLIFVETPEALSHAEIFHSKCPACTHEDLPALCITCNHLRLGHLIFCGPRAPYAPTNITIHWGDWTRLTESTQCSFCRLVAIAASTWAKGGHANAKSDTVDISSLRFRVRISTEYENSGICDIGLITVTPNGDQWYYTAACAHRKHPKSLIDRTLIPPSPRIYHEPVGPGYDWNRIRSWLQDCDTNHKACGNSNVRPRPRDFRTIDVFRRKIVKPDTNNRFFALSYVWGRPDHHTGTQKLMALRSNISQLEEDGGLQASSLPSAIEDAMQICRMLGERYLWVDRLCIIQDNKNDKTYQISSMAGIYPLASLVIVLAHASDMETPVPGIGISRPDWSSVCQLPNGVLYHTLPRFDDIISCSDWYTRGWCLQEAELSSKKLYFTRFYMSYVCAEGLVYEDCYHNQDHALELDKRQKPWKLSTKYSGIIYYCGMASRYNRLVLTYPEDIFNAFAGFLGSKSNEPEPGICNLPKNHFDQALLWYPSRSEYPTVFAKRHSDVIAIPSWSWACVKENLCFGVIDAPLVKWYNIKIEHGTMVFTHIDSSSTTYESWEDWDDRQAFRAITGREPLVPGRPDDALLGGAIPHLSIAIAASLGLFETDLALPQEPLLPAENFTQLGQELLQLWPHYKDFWDVAFRPLTLSETELQLEDTEPHTPLAIIGTRAEMLSVRVREHDHLQEPDRRDKMRGDRGFYDIITQDGSLIGLLAPSLLLDDMKDELPHRNLTCIAVSIGPVPACLSHPYGGHGWKQFEYRSENEKEKGVTPVVNVLLLENRGHGNCYTRLSIGWIFMKTWIGFADKERKVVLIA